MGVYKAVFFVPNRPRLVDFIIVESIGEAGVGRLQAHLNGQFLDFGELLNGEVRVFRKEISEHLDFVFPPVFRYLRFGLWGY